MAVAVLLAVGSLTACARAPQQRPDDAPNVPGVPANPATDTGEAVKGTIATIPGTGPSEAVVLGNVALVALNLDSVPNAGFGPGPGPNTGGATGTREVPLTAPLVGGPGATTAPTTPDTTVNRPGLTNVGIGQPGGQVSTGPAVPGGSPTGTGTTPNVTGEPGLVGTATPGLTNAPGQGGTAADLYTRVSNAIRDRFPWITEVRFAVRPEDARHLAAIAGEMRNGRPITERLADLQTLARNMSPTSTTEMGRALPGFGRPTPGAGPAAPGAVPGPRTGPPAIGR